jgi:hypothetical protein
VNEDDTSSRERALLVTFALAENLLFVLMIGSMYAALVWRPGAYVLLVAFTGRVLNHMAQGVVSYRIVMARPWAEVAPIDDDDW